MSERPAGDLDWTRDETGHSNSSREYLRLVAEVERIIRDSAHALILGRADSVARTIVSNLAHKHGMRLCDDARDRGLMSAKAGGAQQLVEESPNRASGDEGLSAAPSAAKRGYWIACVALGVVWSAAALSVGYSPIHSWQAWVIFGGCEAAFMLGRAVPYGR